MFDSPAIRAASVDSINDVLASSIAFAGIIGVALHFVYMDSVAGILVAMFIFKSGYEVGRENIDYLMGRSAPPDFDQIVKTTALGIRGVKGINDLRSHYVGNKFHIEIHIEVDKNLTTFDSHAVGNEVRNMLERLDRVQKAFVHIDPV